MFRPCQRHSFLCRMNTTQILIPLPSNSRQRLCSVEENGGWRWKVKHKMAQNHNPVAHLLSGQKVQQQPRTHRCYGARGSAPNPNYLSTMILQMGIKSHSQIVVEILTGYRANRDFDVEWTCPSGGFIFKGQLNRATRRRIFTGFQNRAWPMTSHGWKQLLT